MFRTGIEIVKAILAIVLGLRGPKGVWSVVLVLLGFFFLYRSIQFYRIQKQNNEYKDLDDSSESKKTEKIVSEEGND